MLSMFLFTQSCAKKKISHATKKKSLMQPGQGRNEDNDSIRHLCARVYTNASGACTYELCSPGAPQGAPARTVAFASPGAFVLRTSKKPAIVHKTKPRAPRQEERFGNIIFWKYAWRSFILVHLTQSTLMLIRLSRTTLGCLKADGREDLRRPIFGIYSLR